MTTSQEFRQYADECLRWAQETTNEEQRQQFLEMASAWMQAASLQDGKLRAALHAGSAVAAKHPHRDVPTLDISPVTWGRSRHR